jgi:hypothetical protein
VRLWLRNGTMPKTAPHAIWPKKQEGKSIANCTHATQQTVRSFQMLAVYSSSKMPTFCKARNLPKNYVYRVV